MDAAGCNADLGAHAKLAAIGKLRRGIVHDDAGIDFCEEPACCRFVCCQDAFGMARAISVDVGQRAVQTVNQFDRKRGREILGAPVVFTGRFHVGYKSAGSRIGAHLAIGSL